MLNSFCKNRVFYILVVVIVVVLCEFFYTFFGQQVLEFSTTTKSINNNKNSIKVTISLPPLLLNGRQRPRDDFILKVENVEKNCGNWKRIMVKDCLEYLDQNEKDYVVPYHKIKGASKPPSCINRNNNNRQEINKIIYLNEVKQQDSSSSNIMLFHVFWKGKISDKLALMMKSFIYSQPLECSKLYVWIEDFQEDLTSNKNMKLLNKFIPNYIEIKNWDTESQLSSIGLFNGWNKIIKRVKPVSFSDLVRFTVLYKYGGIYIDADILLLRDMRPFYHSNMEFSYRWSYLNDYNTAVLRLWNNSNVAELVIKGAMKNMMKFHPFQVKEYLLLSNDKIRTMKELNKNLYMLPVGLFDPMWLKNDRKQINTSLSPNLDNLNQVFSAKFTKDEFPDVSSSTKKISPLSLRKTENFFRGAYAYHWHNNWDTEILPTSWMGIIQTTYDQFIKGKRRNLYNEVLIFLS